MTPLTPADLQPLPDVPDDWHDGDKVTVRISKINDNENDNENQ